MTKQVQRRRGTATQHTSFTGAEGELSVNTTNKSVHVHDNVTAGGFEAARADMDNVTSSSILTAAGITATTAELNYVDGVTSNIQTQLDGKAGTASPTFTGTLTTANLTATGTTTLAGASTSADITFGDNDKAVFGASSDLSIYHDGTHSRIDDAGTGKLILRGNDAVEIHKYTGEYMITAAADGAVTLYHDDSSKLATSAVGIDVTGTVTADSLTVDGTSQFNNDVNITAVTSTGPILTVGGGNVGRIELTTSALYNAFIEHKTFGSTDTYIGNSYNNDAGEIHFVSKSDDTSLAKKNLTVQNNGDISFYEDTGTTPKFYWDASAESLGIGTSSPSVPLHINTSGTSMARFVGGNDGNLYITNDSANVVTLQAAGGDALSFNTNGGNERMRIDSSGNVGIGTSSPLYNLDVGSGSGSNSINIFSGSTDTSSLYFTDSTTGTGSYIGRLGYNHTADAMLFTTNASERMRIDSSGNLLVGTTSDLTDANISAGVTGIALRSNKQLAVSRTGNTVAQFNRNTSDGDIVAFRKDGTTVGSIGHDDTSSATHKRTYIGYGDTGLAFIPTLNEIVGHNTSTNAPNSSITLGDQNVPFEDLYLSGGVYLGGTGAANKLEDYEEGTWTPTGNGITYSSAFGSYVKVGRLVMITFNVTFPSTSDTNSARIESLPFTVTTGNAYQSGAYVTASDAGTIIDDTYFTISTSRLLIRNNGNGDRDNNQYSAKFIQGSAVYMTD